MSPIRSLTSFDRAELQSSDENCILYSQSLYCKQAYTIFKKLNNISSALDYPNVVKTNIYNFNIPWVFAIAQAYILGPRPQLSLAWISTVYVLTGLRSLNKTLLVLVCKNRSVPLSSLRYTLYNAPFEGSSPQVTRILFQPIVFALISEGIVFWSVRQQIGQLLRVFHSITQVKNCNWKFCSWLA